VLVVMVRHHLLLPDVATRRDLDDEATIAAVVAAVETVDTLELLAALTEADSIATGPSAWGPWKAELVDDLVDRAARALGADRPDRSERPERTAAFPTPEHRALLATGQPAIVAEGPTLTVVAPDRPGLFSRVAGVLSLHDLGVLAADALSDDTGLALEHFRVQPPRDEPVDWRSVEADLVRALAGRLAVGARLADRARTYASRRSGPAGAPPTMLVDNAASSTATVIEVHARDAIGVLYRITHALAELDVDIRTAKVQTLGHRVVDAFYVRGSDGQKITDTAHLAEIERAVLHGLAEQSTG